MDFLGARYNLNHPSDKTVFMCQRYKNPATGSQRTGYFIFQREIRQQLKEEYPELPHTEISKLAGKAWRALPTYQRDRYYRKASASGRTRVMQERCPGRLRFRTTNGRVQLSVEGLVDYVPHSEELSIVPIGLLRVSVRDLIEDFDSKFDLLTGLSFRSPSEGANSIPLTLVLRWRPELAPKWQTGEIINSRTMRVIWRLQWLCTIRMKAVDRASSIKQVNSSSSLRICSKECSFCS